MTSWVRWEGRDYAQVREAGVAVAVDLTRRINLRRLLLLVFRTDLEL